MGNIINAFRYGKGWQPTDLGADLIGWWNAAAVSSISKDAGGLVSQWNDLSGNNYHLTQATEANRPTWQSSVQNNKPGISFSTNDFLTNASIAVTQPMSVVFVIKNPGISKSTDQYVFDSTSVSNRIYVMAGLSTGDDDYVIYAGTAIDTGYGYSTLGEINIATYNDPTDSSFRYNGAETSFGAPGAQTLSGLTLGSSYNQTDFLSAHLCEMFIADKVLTATDIENIDKYLKPKWGISY